MGTVYNRGTRATPLWYVSYREHGKRVTRASHMPTKAQAKLFLGEIESRVARGTVGIEESGDAPMFEPLFTLFLEGLTNRNAKDDRSRGKRHVMTVFGKQRVSDVTLPKVMEWIDTQRAQATLSESSIRQNMNLLSRFFSWAIARGTASLNPVRQMPIGSRPTQAVKSDTPWLNDDAIVRKLIAELEEPIHFMFYLCNRSGLRTGEAAGLRMADLSFIGEGSIRVRFSFDGPLKEDKKGAGKVKWTPAPEDCEEFLGPWLAQRQAQGAGPESLAFPCAGRKGGCYRKEYIEQCWEKASPKHVGEMKVSRKQKNGAVIEKSHPTMTWYQATRHSFVSRNLAAGASLDEVSAAVGHSSPVVTKRYYDHFLRKTFSPRLRAGLGLGKQSDGATVVPIRK